MIRAVVAPAAATTAEAVEADARLFLKPMEDMIAYIVRQRLIVLTTEPHIEQIIELDGRCLPILNVAVCLGYPASRILETAAAAETALPLATG